MKRLFLYMFFLNGSLLCYQPNALQCFLVRESSRFALYEYVLANKRFTDTAQKRAITHAAAFAIAHELHRHVRWLNFKPDIISIYIADSEYVAKRISKLGLAKQYIVCIGMNSLIEYGYDKFENYCVQKSRA